MKNNNFENKKHWQELGSNYSNVWISNAKQSMDTKERNFITKYQLESEQKTLLDIGVGNGRILNNILKNTTNTSQLYGIDISDEMVRICREKFKENNTVKDIQVCDIANEEIPYAINFDFVTAIRVLKYNKNWKDSLTKIYNKLNNGGIFVFCILNTRSANAFAKYHIPLYKSNTKETVALLHSIGYEILEMKSFTRIPDRLYDLSNNSIYVTLLLGTEKLFEILLGKTFLGRIIFIAVKK